MAAEKSSRAHTWTASSHYFQTAGKCKALRPLKLRNFQFCQASQPSKAASTAVFFCFWATSLALLLLVEYASVLTFLIFSSFQSLCIKFFPFCCRPASSHHFTDPLLSSISAPFLMYSISWNCPSCLLIILPLFIETICLNSLGPSKSPVSYVLFLLLFVSKHFSSISYVRKLASFCTLSLPKRTLSSSIRPIPYSICCILFFSSQPIPFTFPFLQRSSKENTAQKFASTELNHEIEFAYANEIFQTNFQNHVQTDIKHNLTHSSPPNSKQYS